LLFFRTLLPLVVVENERLRAERRWLAEVMRNGYLATFAQRARLQRLLDAYGMERDAMIDADLLERLYRRIDVIPPGLVLAQAANESGWGTSRFSREVNNLFGEWTYRAEHGVVPLRRRDGASHYVRRFDSLRHSVRSYLNNLNRNRAYRSLRALRASLRRQGREPDALILAGGLARYSARGGAYVAEIRTMIRSNGLNELGPLNLARSARAD
jgi:Bax protein